MCKCKKIILMFMACVILVNSVFAQAIVVYANSETLNGIYELDLSSPLNTQYNDENCVTQVSVTEKNVTGNTKHYLTWKNADGYDNDKVKVEIYAQIYLNVIDSEDMKIENDELENMKWNELALPVVRCCQVSANVKKACVNFTDLWNTLESVPDADLSKYNNWEAVSAVVDTIADLTVIFSNADTLGITQNTTARARYALTNGKTANYIKYSRVKYYARYVYCSDPSQIFNGSDSENMCYSEDIKSKDFKKFYSTDKYYASGRYAAFPVGNGTYCAIGENNFINKTYDNKGTETGCRETGSFIAYALNGNYTGEYDSFTRICDYIGPVFTSEDTCDEFIKNGTTAGLLNYGDKYYKCGRVVENDTEMNDDNLAYDTDAEHNKSNSTPYPVITDPGDTGDEDSNTDVVYWLKKIYRRLGAMLSMMVVDNLVDFLNDFVNGLVGDFTEAMESVTDNAESRFPFSVMYLVPVLLKVFVAEPKKPVMEYEFKIPENKALGIKEIAIPLKFDKLDYIDKYVAISRNIELAAFIVYLVYYTFDVISFVRNGGMTSD